HGRSRAGLAHALAHGHRDRIGLLAGRAAGNPYPERVRARGSRGDELADLQLERRERLRVAEERGHADEEIPEEELGLTAVGEEQAHVLVGAVEVVEPRAPFNPAY